MPDLESVRADQAVRILLEETDPVRRARAHYVLSRRALERDDEPSARDHLSEAIDLDPTDERPRVALKDLTRPEVSKRGLASVFRFLRRE